MGPVVKECRALRGFNSSQAECYPEKVRQECADQQRPSWRLRSLALDGKPSGKVRSIHQVEFRPLKLLMSARIATGITMSKT
jgi:hypothetical protein